MQITMTFKRWDGYGYKVVMIILDGDKGLIEEIKANMEKVGDVKVE